MTRCSVITSIARVPLANILILKALFIAILVGVGLLVILAIAVLGLVSLSLAAFLSAALTTATLFVGLFLAVNLFFFTAAVVVGVRKPQRTDDLGGVLIFGLYRLVGFHRLRA